jgi:hypothetical protein
MLSKVPENVLRRDRIIVHFRSYYGPMHKAFDSLDPDGREALKSDLKELIGYWNISGDETAIFPSDYLEVEAVRR